MAANEPTAKNLADLYQLAPLDWDDVRRTLETNLTQEPGTGGPGHHAFWLSTLDGNGRLHMTAVSAYWVDGGCGPTVAVHLEPTGPSARGGPAQCVPHFVVGSWRAAQSTGAV